MTTTLPRCVRCEIGVMMPDEDGERCANCGRHTYREASENRRSGKWGHLGAQEEERGYTVPYRGDEKALRDVNVTISLRPTERKTIIAPVCPFCGEGMVSQGQGYARKGARREPGTASAYRCVVWRHAIVLHRNRVGEAVSWG